MSSPCEKMQDRIVDMLLGLLGQTESQALRDHIDGCDRCRQYYYSMQDQQSRLASMGEILNTRINAQQENVVSALHHLTVAPDSAWKKLLHSQPARLVAAILIAATIAIAIVATIALKPPTGPIAKNQSEPTIQQSDTTTKVTSNDSKQDNLPALLDRARRMYRAGDVAGLIGLLSSDTSKVSIAAADYLAQIGDATALTPLLQATQQWQDDDGENPYIAAIKSIFERIRRQEQDDDQADTFAVDPNTATADTTPEPEPELKPESELKPVTNVHITEERLGADGTTLTGNTWIRLPDRLYQDSPDSTFIVIENGTERLELNKKTMEAQLSDSRLSFEPLPDHPIFKSVTWFRDQPPEHMSYRIVNELSSDKTLVYDIQYELIDNASITSWVNASTMLPKKIETINQGKPNAMQGIAKSVITFDYSPIPDSVFEMKLPPGYTMGPRKEASAFTGQIVDDRGNPIAGAEVKVRDRVNAAWIRNLKTVTDEDGYFVLKTPPGQEYTGAALLWATIPDELDFVAWTIIASEPQDKLQKHASPIPGEPGREVDTGTEARLIEDIVLTMEPAGMIAGHVTDDNGDPIPNTKVEARFVFTDDMGNSIHRYSSLPWQSTAMTDETGFYILGQLPRFWKNRRYEISSVTAAGYSQSAADVTTFTTIGPLDTKTLDFVLLPTGVTVTGTLTDNYGLPLPYRYIVARVDGYTVRNCRTTTDTAGQFRIEDCPIGYDVTIVAELGQTQVVTDGQIREVDFYPQAETQIEFIEGLDEYDVQIVAERPEFVVEVETVDSAGRALPFFPVDVQAAPGHEAYPPGKPLSGRTDENGYCIITNVPNVPGLKLVFNASAGVPNDFLSTEQADQIRQKYRNYQPTEVPVEVLPGQNEYFIRAVINNQ